MYKNRERERARAREREKEMAHLDQSIYPGCATFVANDVSMPATALICCLKLNGSVHMLCSCPQSEFCRVQESLRGKVVARHEMSSNEETKASGESELSRTLDTPHLVL